MNVTVDKTHHNMGGTLLSRIKAYRAILENSEADLLITYNWGSVEWALANSFGPILRHIHVESGFGPDEANGTLLKRDLFRRLSLRNIEALSVPSNTLIEIAKNKWKIAQQKINYIPNGVDLEKFARPAQDFTIDELVRTENDVIIGTMAPLRPEKNISRLINSFKQIKLENAKLVIMGEGVERERLEVLARELDISDKVIFTGYVSDTASALGLIDIFAISSDTEQMPNAVNEAMAAGLPVAGLSVGDVKHMVSSTNKDFIVAAGDDQAFQVALKTLATDKEKQQLIGKANLNHVTEHYGLVDMYKKYAELWGIR
ncbi:MAG: glycosyltransferase [Kordiimonadaceae bacterium]|nr:glycosyltransferase [Kordiimonadaceae bacterium]MBT6330758.1 glycosyltransferase [Kordiimonadaceae bacterium]MBT7581350.1 glycosyltransferase [Kordiimonadaceae bacterium]